MNSVICVLPRGQLYVGHNSEWSTKMELQHLVKKVIVENSEDRLLVTLFT